VTGAVALPAPRAIVTDTSAGLEITIPAKRSLPQLFFMGLWLAGWSAGETVVIQQLTSGGPRSIADLFLLGWLVAWTVAGGVVAHSWLWTAFGRERMVLRPAVLSLQRKILGIGRTRQYDLGQVSNLRVAPWADEPPDDASSRRRGVRGRQRGAVAFDYGPETVRFAEAIDHAEATQLVERLKSRHAFR
jgi:hypothetical protein